MIWMTHTGNLEPQVRCETIVHQRTVRGVLRTACCARPCARWCSCNSSQCAQAWCCYAWECIVNVRCAFIIILFCNFSSAMRQPDEVRTSTFPQNDNHSCSCRASIQEDATVYRMSYCMFLWGPCKAIATFYHSGFYLWDFGSSMDFAHSAAWKNSETDLMVNFFHAYSYRGGFCNFFLSLIARWFPIVNDLQEFFIHVVLFLDSWPRRSSQNFQFWNQKYFDFLAWYFSLL